MMERRQGDDTARAFVGCIEDYVLSCATAAIDILKHGLPDLFQLANGNFVVNEFESFLAIFVQKRIHEVELLQREGSPCTDTVNGHLMSYWYKIVVQCLQHAFTE